MAVVVLLEREDVRVLELGIPSHVGWKTGEVQLVWAVEPLVREPRLGNLGAVGLDPLLVCDARGQVVHHIQELELGRVDEHDAPLLHRREAPALFGHERDEVLADELEIVVARVEAQHRHLGDPLHDEFAPAFRDSLWVWREVPPGHIRHDCCVAALQGLVEAMDQLRRVPGDDVLRLGVERVCDGDRDGDVLAVIQEIAGRAGSLAQVLARFEVVDNRVGVRFRLLFNTSVCCPGRGFFVLPLLNHRVAGLAEMLGPLQGEAVSSLSRD